MVEVLVIPDGAGEPILQAADTPVLDELARTGQTASVATTPPGLAPGSENCIPALLGCPPSSSVGRGRVDAAAYEVPVPVGMIPWRADVLDADGGRATRADALAMAATLGPDAIATAGHRLLLLAPRRPPERPRLRVWDDGETPDGALPTATAIVCAVGAAAGIGRLLGAHVIVPAGATGDVDTDLAAKLRAALAAIDEGWPRVVVHIGGPDEAAHRRQPEQAIEMIRRIDGELLAPLRDHVQASGGRLTVCPDHGTDPASGRHDATPVRAISWSPGR